jgi:aminopeptidase N
LFLKKKRPIVTSKFDSSWNMYDNHLYPGGSCRLHMLRQRLGDEAFWSGVQLYVQRFAKKTVKTSDFQNCLEEVSGLNLSRFFDEWLYSKGYPALKGDYSYDLEKNRVQVVLSQTQVDTEIPLFGIDLDIQVITDSNETLTSTVHFDQDATVTTFIDLPKGQKPSQIAIDPDFNVLFSLDMSSVDRQVLIETAKNGRSIPNRIWAYSELIKSGTRPALKAVQELIKNEPFYGVRVECKIQTHSTRNMKLTIFLYRC